MKCSRCKGPVHRGKDGRFARRGEFNCPYYRTEQYRYTKALFYETLESLMKPSIFDPPGGAAA